MPNPLLQPIQSLRSKLAESSEVAALAEDALAHSNGSASENTYLWQDRAWTMHEAARAAAMPRTSGGEFGDGRPSLWGLPVSVKDCFDLAGSPTSCGTHFYRDLHGVIQEDSWLVERLRTEGAVITGKTHLHPLAYGITGENPDFGDCRQPGNENALTGGSSSGAAASVLEASAVAAIGTDTGGSIRVPAALCGLAGYRASLGRGDWRGGAHLAESFDTMGWLFRFLEDGPLLGSLFGPTAAPARLPTKFAVLGESFLHDCEPAVLDALQQCRLELEALGLESTVVEIDWWADSMEIFAPIQAWEAARIHHGHFESFEPSICQRLALGASLSAEEIARLRARHVAFHTRMDHLLAEHELLLMPAAPVVQLTAGADHSQTRMRLLRYTTPISLAGMPAVTLPCLRDGRPAGGMQLVAAREHDAALLAIAAQVGIRRRMMQTAAM